MKPLRLNSFLKLLAVLGCGMGLCTPAVVAAESTAAVYLFTHLAGPLGGPGNADGLGSAARFNNPWSLSVDSAGNVFVSDSGNHTIRKITADGMVTTLGGSTGRIAVDKSGNIYSANSGNHTIEKTTPAGVVTSFAGRAGAPGNADGIGSAAQFNRPAGLAVDNSGNIFVVDMLNNTIRKITPEGVVSTLAGSPGSWGNTDGTGAEAQFGSPYGIAVDRTGTLYVTDLTYHNIRKITPAGVVTTLAGYTTSIITILEEDGIGPAARFAFPNGITVDNAGIVYVADLVGTIRKITPDGVVTTWAGYRFLSGSVDGVGTGAQFRNPADVVVDNVGNVYVADAGNNTVRKITPDAVVTTLAGLAGNTGTEDGMGENARLNSPGSAALDSAGNLYVADQNNHTIRKVTPEGATSTLAGNPKQYGATDGIGSAARFYGPTSTAVDGTGNVYVADESNHTIRKITPSGGVTTLAGIAQSPGNTDGTGTLARFNLPYGVAADSAGVLYVTDSNNHTVRRITQEGVVTTLAGAAGLSGYADGNGTTARFNTPQGLAVDSAGNVFVADEGNGKVRKISPTGTVTTLTMTDAGLQKSVLTADAATVVEQTVVPSGVAVDRLGNVFVTDQIHSTIHQITPGGAVTVLGGTKLIQSSTDGIGVISRFNSPAGVTVDTAGNLFVADSGNSSIRKGLPAGPPTITAQPLSKNVEPGANVQFSVTAGGVPAPTYQWYFNGSEFNGAKSNELIFASARSTDSGDYTVVVTNPLGTVTSSKATLTVGSAHAPTPTPTPTPAPSGGSGGGSIEAWFGLALFTLILTRRWNKNSVLA